MYPRFLKKIIDILGVFVLAPLLLPIFLAVFLCLLFANRGKVFFVQERPGYLGKPFKILKFRTLSDKKTGTDRQKATPIGYILRKTYLDELPQVVNILKGEMSWIGPRPLLSEYMSLYTPIQHLRHCVRPGITGLAQIHEPKNATLEEKTRWDIEYIQQVSWKMDFKILLGTIRKIWRA